MTPPDITITIAFAQIGERPVNVRATRHLESYYQSAIVTLASFRKHLPSAELLFVTNAEPPDDFLRELRKLDGVVQYVPFEHEPPADFHHAFKAAQYLIDAVLALSRPNSILFVDPDVVCMQAPSLPADAIAAYRINYPVDYRVNGLSRSELAEIGGASGGLSGNHDPLDYYGGEALLVGGEHAEHFRQLLDAEWRGAIRDFEAGEWHVKTEEHMISRALARVPHVLLNGTVRRIWTANSFRTVDPSDRDVPIWHLPAEKNRGLQKVYGVVCSVNSWFWMASGEEWRRRLSRLLRVEPSRPARVALLVLAGLGAARARLRGDVRTPRGIFGG